MTTTDPEVTGISMLYVEDEKSCRDELVEIFHLKYPDIRLYVAEDGKAGLELFKIKRPEIVITDINMPGIDGITMSSEIRKLCPAVEIIVLTAYTDTKFLLKAIEIGITNYVIKPVNIDKLFKSIDKSRCLINSKQEAKRQNDEIRQLNTELARMTASLEMSNLELESFNYTVAHDLRSPMVTISGYSQLLLDQYASLLDDDCKRYIEIINLETVRMSGLVGVLLRFSVQTHRHPNKSTVSLSKIAHEIKDRLLLQEPCRLVKFSIAEEANAYCDPELMRIVLEKLLENAWKYSVQNDAAEIEFGLKQMEDDIVYFVRDNGVGFEQLEADKLFIPFQRLQSTTDVEGFGIGLATASRIILRHGGRIWAEGGKGMGATFYFTL